MKKRYSFGWKKVDAVLAKTGGKCFYCGCVLPPDTDHADEIGRVYSSTRNWNIDHGTPLCREGDNTLENLFPSCGPCNHKKGRMTQEEFMGLLPA